MRKPLMSGHCASPSTSDPDASHARCRGGNYANPAREFQPCPCPCHYADLPQYECGGCSRMLVETAIENDDPSDVDEDGDLYPVYFHLAKDGSITSQECP